MHKGRTVLIAGLVTTVAAVAGGVVLSQLNRTPKRFAAVEPGVLYRCGQPSTSQLDALREDYDIKTLLIVRRGDSRRVPEEVAHAEELGMRVEKIPIESRTPISEDDVRRFFQCVDDQANHPVLVHCSAGRHRTGYLCALYRIERQGWTVERAMEEMLSFGFDREAQTVVEQQLRAYVPLRERAARPAAPVEKEKAVPVP